MSADPLPQSVNIRKAVIRKARYQGFLGARELPQFEAMLASDEHALEFTVQFDVDEADRQFIAVTMVAKVNLECQRCLGRTSKVLESFSKLALIHSDEQSGQLSAEYEPLIAIDDVDLWEIAAEELALALPVVAYHPQDECKAPTGQAAAAEDNEGIPVMEESPFSVLSSLLTSDDTEEK